MTLEKFERVVVDTSVVSILFLQHRDFRYEYYVQRLAGMRTLISFQTLEELWFGAYIRGWGAERKESLARYINDFDVIWPDKEMSEISARIRSDTRKAGRELKSADAWIAAAAIRLNCPLATDDRDFSAVADRLTLISRLG